MRRFPPVTKSTEKLRMFFEDTNNYAGGNEDRIFSVVGQPNDVDDWDWGRMAYYWRAKDIAVRAIIQGGVTTSVELIDPFSKERFAQAIRVLWERPAFHTYNGAS